MSQCEGAQCPEPIHHAQKPIVGTPIKNDKELDRIVREDFVRRNILMDKRYSVIRNPMDKRLYAPNKAVKNPQDTKTMGLAQTLVGHLFIENGAGLAAPQIGINQTFFAIKLGPFQAQLFFNARIVGVKDDEKNVDWGQEGCISHPGVWGEVLRLKEFDMLAQTFNHPEMRLYHVGSQTDPKGQFIARVIQHELGHTKKAGGQLFTDLSVNVRNIQVDPEGQLVLQAENRRADEFGIPEPEV